jgi:AraC-like DNA-binding protein
MDPLSDVLSLIKPRSYYCGGFDVGGDLSIQFHRHEGIKCYAVTAGETWLAVEGVADPVRLHSGDCFLLPSGRPFRLASDLALTPIDAMTFIAGKSQGAIHTINGGGNCFIAGGHFTFSGSHAEMLLSALPPIVHLQKESDKAAMRWSLDRMMEELREPRPGSLLIAEQLAYMMLVQALRLHIGKVVNGGVGWLSALADPQINTAIQAVHDDPAGHWTIQKLADQAGMSRSVFALRFKQTAGETPMEYLTRWRMMRAADRLANSRDAVSEVSLAVGYASESAFSTAFRRVMGCSPRQYVTRPAN